MKRLPALVLVALPVLAMNSPVFSGDSCRKAPEAFEKRLDAAAYPVLVVLDVIPGSIAHAAGLRAGDLITSVNGHGMRAYGDAAEFRAQIRERALWGVASLEVRSALEGEQAGRHLFVHLPSPDDRIGFASSQAFYVESVRPGGLAQAMGLRPGDFLHQLGSGERAADLDHIVEFDMLMDQWLAGPASTPLSVQRLKSAENGSNTWEQRQVFLAAVKHPLEEGQ